MGSTSAPERLQALLHDRFGISEEAIGVAFNGLLPIQSEARHVAQRMRGQYRVMPLTEDISNAAGALLAAAVVILIELEASAALECKRRGLVSPYPVRGAGVYGMSSEDEQLPVTAAFMSVLFDSDQLQAIFMAFDYKERERLARALAPDALENVLEYMARMDGPEGEAAYQLATALSLDVKPGTALAAMAPRDETAPEPPAEAKAPEAEGQYVGTSPGERVQARRAARGGYLQAAKAPEAASTESANENGITE